MHVSPCAWYCFEFKDGRDWQVRDMQDRTVVSASDKSCRIELIAARKVKRTEDTEISEYHESYLKEERIVPIKTVVGENPYKVSTIVTRGIGADERFWIVCHAFWSNYCTFIKFQAHQGGGLDDKVQTYFDIVNSLQPLALF